MTTIERPLKYSNVDEYMVPPTGFCAGCGLALALRHCLKVLGDKIVLVTTAGCTGPGSMGSLRHNGKPIDTISSPFGNIAMLSGGISSALRAQGDNETVVVGWGGDGAAFDIGFGSISAAAERNEDFLFVCVDNEGYQNTGNQRSSASPWMSTNSTNPPGFSKMEYKKDIVTILAAHRIPYAATATVGYPDDLMAKVRKAKEARGFRFVHILIPCPSGWGCASEMTMKIARLAVDTSIFPLYEVENGVRLTITHEPKGAPITDYLSIQRRFRGLDDAAISEYETAVAERWRRVKYLAAYGVQP